MKGAIAKAEELERDDPRRGHPAAIREPGQSGDPPPHHGRGDLERHRRRGRHPRLRHRHRRHDHRRRPGAEAAQAGLKSSPSSRRTRRSCPAASPARTRSRASAPASCPTILDTSIYRRDRHGHQRGRRLRPMRGSSRASKACRSASPPGGAIAAALEVGRAPRMGGQEHRHHHPVLRRALSVDGAVRGACVSLSVMAGRVPAHHRHPGNDARVVSGIAKGASICKGAGYAPAHSGATNVGVRVRFDLKRGFPSAASIETVS